MSPENRRSSAKTRPQNLGPNTWSLYVAECADGSYYTGIAKDVEKRIEAHNAGKGAKYTATHGPVKLVLQEPQASYSAALRREYQIKTLPKERKVRFVQGEKLKKPPKKAKMSFQKNQKRKPKVNTKTQRDKVKIKAM